MGPGYQKSVQKMAWCSPAVELRGAGRKLPIVHNRRVNRIWPAALDRCGSPGGLYDGHDSRDSTQNGWTDPCVSPRGSWSCSLIPLGDEQYVGQCSCSFLWLSAMSFVVGAGDTG